MPKRTFWIVFVINVLCFASYASEVSVDEEAHVSNEVPLNEVPNQFVIDDTTGSNDEITPPSIAPVEDHTLKEEKPHIFSKSEATEAVELPNKNDPAKIVNPVETEVPLKIIFHNETSKASEPVEPLAVKEPPKRRKTTENPTTIGNLNPTESEATVEILQKPEPQESPEMGELKKRESSKAVISYGCPVDHTLPCIAKCCGITESHTNFSTNRLNKTECVPNSNYQDFYVNLTDCPDYNVTVDVISRYEYFIGIPCTTGKYVLDPEKYPEDAYSIFSNGTLQYANKMFSMSDYCIDTVDGDVKIFVCFDSVPPGEIDFYHILYPVGQIISIMFLLATAAVYLGLEQFRDLQGKSLVCHVLCLTVAFIFLASVQLIGSNPDPSFCVVAAFIIQFSFVACFFWLNVLCFDTYRNIKNHFQTAKYSRIHRKEQGLKTTLRSEKRMFILYSIYAWNMPLILLIVSLVLDNVPGIPDTLLKPNFGVRSCWFSTETAALPYFFGPVGLLLGVNAILFGMAVFIVFREEKAAHEEARLHERDDDVERSPRKKWIRRMTPYVKALKQCVLLFIIMGLSWLAEVISWAVGGSKYIWVTTDIINTLQGFLIFIVFVIKPRPVRNAVKKLLIKWWGMLTHCDIHYRPVRTDDPPAQHFNPDIDQDLPLDNNMPLSTFKPD